MKKYLKYTPNLCKYYYMYRIYIYTTCICVVYSVYTIYIYTYTLDIYILYICCITERMLLLGRLGMYRKGPSGLEDGGSILFLVEG